MIVVFETWELLKVWVTTVLGLGNDALHVLAGITLLGLFAAIARKPLGTPALLLPIAAIAGLNEVMDFGRYYIVGWPWTMSNAVIDFILTIAPPTAIILAAIGYRAATVRTD